MASQLSEGTVLGTVKDLNFLEDIDTVFKDCPIFISGAEVR